MAKLQTTITAKMPREAEFQRFAEWFEGLPEEEQERFQHEWSVLKEAGAELADVGFVYGVVHCWISHDLRQHCARFGYIWPEAG